MAFKFVLFAAVCLAQGFAFNPLRELQTSNPENDCNDVVYGFASELGQTMDEIDAVREGVSMAAMEAFATGRDVIVVVRCFRQQRPNYIRLGVQVSRMLREATQEISETLQEKADRYSKRMEGPIKALTVTFTTVPVKVYNYIQNKQFVKAALLMLEARKVVKKNSMLLGEAIRDMVAEVPEMADRVEELTKAIYTTARTGSENINAAFRKCVEEGGPKKPASASEEEEEISEDSQE